MMQRTHAGAPIARRAAPFALALGFSLAVGFAGCAPGSDDVQSGATGAPSPPVEEGDALPGGTISFYNSAACPEGWIPFSEGEGRVVVPTVGQEEPLSVQGSPLEDGEDRLHDHAIKAEVSLDSVTYAGVAGEANHNVAKAQVVAVSATAEKASSGLPYVQLLACKKLGEPRAGRAPVPRGLLIFFNGTSCPEGWEQPIATQGRMVVGLPEGAAPGLSFGGTSLKPGEERPHGHAVNGTLTTEAQGIALASGCCAEGYAKNGSYPVTGTAVESGVALPTVQLLQCQKM